MLVEDLWHDFRFGIRSLRRNALWTAIAVLIVALAVGASVIVFSLVHALLLRPLPFDEPDRLVWISNGDAHDLSARTVQVGHLWTVQAESRVLTDLAGYSEFYRQGDHHLLGAGEPERLTGIQVTENFFPLLGVEPRFGRGFTAEESTWGGPPAVLLSHNFWERRFAADPGMVGSTITIDGEAVLVAGVLPASFDFGSIFAPGRRIDFFSPFPLSPETHRRGNTLALVGRLRAGATAEAAQQEITALVTQNIEREGYNRFRPLVRPLRDHVSGGFRPAMMVLGGAVGLVMLIMCANLSNLLLIRTASREKEMAVRAALGAGRSRLIRQLLTESLVLSGGGAALGLLLAVAGTRLLARSDALMLPLLDQVRVDWTVLGFAIAAALLTGLAFGLAPALHVSTAASQEALKDASRGSSVGKRHGWVRGALVVSELMLACMLLIGAGLMMRSFLKVLDVDLGFQPRGVVTVRIDPSSSFPSPEHRTAYYEEALARVRAAPGIQEAGLTDVLPFTFNRTWSISADGVSLPEGENPYSFVRLVSEGFLGTMGIPLRAGRDFSALDAASGRPVVIVNETLAEMLWPGENPLGRSFSAGWESSEVVGVVADTRHQTLEEASGAEMYFPLRQFDNRPFVYNAIHIVARGALSPAGLFSAVHSAIQPMDPTLPLTEGRVIQEIVDQSAGPRRLVVLLLVGFAGFALVLASLGVYGVIAYGVVQRRREIGIRIALGASARAVQGGIVMQTMKLAMTGIVLGLAGSWVLARMIQSLLFEVPATDPLTFAVALTTLAGTAALAGYLPARRASRMDPVEAIRAE